MVVLRINYVHRARFNRPEHGIIRGHPYWWVQPYNAPRRFFLAKPRDSQLTTKRYLINMHVAFEAIEDSDVCSILDINALVEQIKIAQEAVNRSLENMNPGLKRTSPATKILTDRKTWLADWLNNLSSIKDAVLESPHQLRIFVLATKPEGYP